MENDINKIIATKRDWRNAERRKAQRRIKDGTPEDRKDLADVLRAGRHQIGTYCSCSMCEYKEAENLDKFLPVRWWTKLWRMIFPVVLVMVLSGSAFAYSTHDAILAVIGEAEGEGLTGLEAVACSIRNRGTLHGVYGLHASRVVNHKYSQLTLDEAKYAVKQSLDHDFCDYMVHGAQYWEGTAFPTPYWARTMKLTAVIGHQRFYRKD